MPRLRAGSKATEPTRSLRDLLADRGAFARCIASHTSRAGYTERGSVRPLQHQAVTVAPEHFDVVISAAKLEE